MAGHEATLPRHHRRRPVTATSVVVLREILRFPILRQNARRRTPRADIIPLNEIAVKSLGVVFFRSGGDGGQDGAVASAGVGAVVGLEHVGQVSQGGLGEVSAFSVLPLLVLFE